MRCRNSLQLFQRFDPALGLSCLGGLGFKAGDERFQMLYRALLFFKRALLHRQLHRALIFKA